MSSFKIDKPYLIKGNRYSVFAVEFVGEAVKYLKSKDPNVIAEKAQEVYKVCYKSSKPNDVFDRLERNGIQKVSNIKDVLEYLKQDRKRVG